MEILLLKALPDEDFDNELQQMLSFFSIGMHKFKLGPTENFDPFVDEKQVGIKDAITIISSLYASQNLLASI